MKANATCPKCGKKLEEDCRACIESGTCVHTCNGEEHVVVEGIEWKLCPEDEKDLEEMERKKGV